MLCLAGGPVILQGGQICGRGSGDADFSWGSDLV